MLPNALADKVIIGFTQQPGPAERALVRNVGGTIKYTYHLVPAIAADVPGQVIARLRANRQVINIHPDGKVFAIDVELDNTWGVKRIGAGTVHDGGNKGTDVNVAVIDSGIDYTHPDLDANYVGGYDFVNDDTDPMDDYGHGTHVAGTVAAEDDGVGVVGVAPEAQLYALKVLGSDGSGFYSDVIAALQWCVDNGIQVTNNSYGSSSDPGEAVKTAFDNAVVAGVLHVAAAGNSGNPPGKGDNVIFPARWDSVIAVAATERSDKRARFSSTGPDVELSAPGVDINSTLLGGSYGEKSGTSMASPHVAGTAALVMVAYPSWTNAEVRTQLQNTADYLGDSNLYGYGLVDADEAAPQTDVHDVAVTAIAAPNSVVAGDTATIDVTVENQGTYNETFDVVLTDDTDGVTIGTESVSLAAGASTTVNFSWDTTDATPDVDHTLTAMAGPVSEETDTADNSRSTVVTVESPVTDIAITAVDTPSSVVQGDQVDVKVTVENVGNQNVTADITVTLTDTPPADGTAGTVTDSPQTITGGLAAGASTILTFSWDTGSASLGDHTLTASHDFADDDATTNDSKSTTVTVNEVVANIMYVESIVFSSKVAGPNQFLYTTVKVVDGGGIALGGVRVEITLDWDKENDGTIDDSWNFAGDTGSDGTVEFTLLKTPNGYYTATVTGLTLTDCTWDKTKGVISASCKLENGTVTPQGAALAPALAEFKLLQNNPNPVNPETWIPYALGKAEHVVIKIYSVTGQLVRTLDIGERTAGAYLSKDRAAYWDGKNANGERVSSGVYFYLMEAGSFRAMRKMVIMK